MIRLFISHSSEDENLAALLVELFRAGLELSPSEIRCSSVGGFRLPIGADTAEELRHELTSAEVFLGLISEAALSSSYVLFELGARWGAQLDIAPLLTHGIDPELLPAPIAGTNALRAERAEDVQQMLSDVSRCLCVDVRNQPLVQKYVDQIVRHWQEAPAQSPEFMEPPSRENDATANREASLSLEEGTAGPLEAPEDADLIIERMCSSRWPDDFRMQSHCIHQQKEAFATLRAEQREDVPEDVLMQIREMCRRRWPEDFRMRLHCEGQQLQAWRDLRRRQ